MIEVTITRLIRPSEAVDMTIWLTKLGDSIHIGSDRMGPTWGDPIKFYREEDAIMFRLKFGV